MRIRGLTHLRLGVFFLSASLAWAGPAPGSKEYQIKAVFLFNFAQFVDWPPSAFAGAEAPLRIGILGEDPFGPVLDRTVAGESVRHRPLAIVRSNRPRDLAGCQLVFISRSEEGALGQVLEELGTKPILTVSEIPDFARRGGIINFYLVGNKVRFEINPAAARRSQLRLSSQLLGVARIVPGTGPAKTY